VDVLIILTTIFIGIAAIGAVINVFVLNKSRRKPVAKEGIHGKELEQDIAEEYHQMYGDK